MVGLGISFVGRVHFPRLGGKAFRSLGAREEGCHFNGRTCGGREAKGQGGCQEGHARRAPDSCKHISCDDEVYLRAGQQGHSPYGLPDSSAGGFKMLQDAQGAQVGRRDIVVLFQVGSLVMDGHSRRALEVHV